MSAPTNGRVDPARLEHSLAAQLERIARTDAARTARRTLKETQVTRSHGSGGKATHALIDALIEPAFRNPLLDTGADAAVLDARGVRLAFTTDSYVVSPLFFPGGDIGRLAVHGTINDLAAAGAMPLALSVALILEEGLEVETLRRVLDSMAQAASAAGVPIVTGDTKVVDRTKADGIFITTSGVGLVGAGITLDARRVVPGDVVLVNGNIADHGTAVMLARDALELESEIESDSAPLHTLVAAVLDAAPGTRACKDPTRGGVATSLNEIARLAGVSIAVEEGCIPIRDDVRGACEILGIDPLHMANEGKMLFVVPPDEAGAALAALRAHPLGARAAAIGTVEAEPKGMVVVRTAVGGVRALDMLVGDPLPRIC